MMTIASGIGNISILIYLLIIGVGAYVTYLIIKALKIYIKKNS